MIKNWNYHNLYMDYSSYTKDNDHPSDIDMFYIGKNNFLIVGEIKNELGKLIGGQRKLYEKLINGWKYDGIALFIVHNKYVQNGDKKVDVPNCKVREYYYNGKWHKPKEEIRVKDILDTYLKKEKTMEIISNKSEIIFRKDFEGKPAYSIGLTRKDKNGEYIRGYIIANFKGEVDIPNKSRIRIKNAWLSFYLKEGKTTPTIFIEDYELVSEPNPEHEKIQDMANEGHYKTKSEIKDIEITDADLPF